MRLEYLIPEGLLPPHRETNPAHSEALERAIRERGWLGPPLIGYRLESNPRAVQLLSGTHRRQAGIALGIRVPVKVYSEAVVRSVWGTDEWARLMTGTF